MFSFTSIGRLNEQKEIKRLNALSEELSSLDILKYILKKQRGKIAAISSFGTESAVLLHHISLVDPNTPVVFLETFKHFNETREYRDLLVESLGLTQLIITYPNRNILLADDPKGLLHQSNTNQCCHNRKTLPMIKVLRPFDYYITGRKRFQTTDRQELEVFEKRDTWINVNPLASWDKSNLDEYFVRYNLPRHPLEGIGYSSIGCECCTSKSPNYREGRWAGSNKTECGIHIDGSGKIKRINT